MMRFDNNLKRQMLQHEREKIEKESFCSSSIATSGASLQEENESDFSSISTFTSTPINEELVLKTMMMNADEYNNKMETGKIIAKAIDGKKIPQDSLSNEHREAVDLFWNKNN